MINAIECPFTISGNGPPLFLIHGIGATRSAWRHLTPFLSQHFTVLTYDLRGHGEAPTPSEPFELDELVADLENVRKRAGFEQAHFAGASLGGMIGPAYARKYPDRVLSLGLLSTAAFRTEQDSSNVWNVVRAMEEKGIEPVLQTLSHRWFTDDFIAENPEVVQARLRQVVDTDPDVFLNVFRIYAGTEMGPWLHEIDKPCLVLTGENDGGCPPRLNQKISDVLPNAQLVILPKYKHSLLLEAGVEVAAHLKDFIQSSIA